MKIPVSLIALILIAMFCISLPSSPLLVTKKSPVIPIIHTSDDHYRGYLENGEGPIEEWIQNRRFLWQYPNSPPPSTGYPVLFVLHGASQDAEAWFDYPQGLLWQGRQTRFVEEALLQGFCVIAPDSLYPVTPGPKAWDVFATTLDESLDLPFFTDLLLWIHTAPVNVDCSRIYCIGFSSGGFMTSRLAHFFGQSFTAVAIHSGANADSITLGDRGPEFDCSSPQNFSPDHPPCLIIHGGKDHLVPPECGVYLYEELQRGGIESQLLFSSWGRHIWLSWFNDAIFDWFSTQE